MSVELLRKCHMLRCLSVLVFLALCASLFAQSVVVLSEDGRTAWYAPNATSTAVLADRVVRLSGDSPLPPTDPPADPPIDPPNNPDQWGLIAVSETAAQSVLGDPNRDDSAGKLMAAYMTLGTQLQDGTIKPDQIKALLDLAFRFATRPSTEAWEPWQAATQAKYNSVQFTDTQKAGQGLIDIGIGVGRTSVAPANAIADFFGWFLKLLPFLMQLIEIFGAAELDSMLSDRGT